MKECPYCGIENPDNQKICSNCNNDMTLQTPYIPIKKGTKITPEAAKRLGFKTEHVDGLFDIQRKFASIDHGDHYWDDYREMKRKERKLEDEYAQNKLIILKELISTLVTSFPDVEDQRRQDIIAQGRYTTSSMRDLYEAQQRFEEFMDDEIMGKEKSEVIRHMWDIFEKCIAKPLQVIADIGKMEGPFSLLFKNPPELICFETPMDDSPSSTIKRIVNATSIVEDAKKIVNFFEKNTKKYSKSIHLPETNPVSIDSKNPLADLNFNRETEKIDSNNKHYFEGKKIFNYKFSFYLPKSNPK